MRPGSFGKIAPRLIMKKAHDVETKVSLPSFQCASFHVPNTCTTVIAQLAPFYNPLPSQQSITSQTEPRLKLAGEVSLGDEFVKKRHNGGEEWGTIYNANDMDVKEKPTRRYRIKKKEGGKNVRLYGDWDLRALINSQCRRDPADMKYWAPKSTLYYSFQSNTKKKTRGIHI